METCETGIDAVARTARETRSSTLLHCQRTLNAAVTKAGMRLERSYDNDTRCPEIRSKSVNEMNKYLTVPYVTISLYGTTDSVHLRSHIAKCPLA